MFIETAEQLRNAYMDILIKFDKFCKDHDLRYYIAYGTLLGAVRHKSFIPWDDDVDVMMFREDFNRLLEIPKEDYPEGWELVTPGADGYFCGFVPMIKDSSYVGKMIKGSDSNNGSENGRLGMDVFVLDPSYRGLKHKIQKFRQYMLYSEARAHRFEDKPLDMSRFHGFEKIYAGYAVKIFQKIGKKKSLESIIRKYDRITLNLKTDGTAVFAPGASPDSFDEEYDLEWFRGTAYVEINGVMFPAPADYDGILRESFGDTYMELPPEECRHPEHFVLKEFQDQ